MADPFLCALIEVEKASRAVLPQPDMTAHEVSARFEELRQALAEMDELRAAARMQTLPKRLALTAADYKTIERT